MPLLDFVKMIFRNHLLVIAHEIILKVQLLKLFKPNKVIFCDILDRDIKHAAGYFPI